MMKYNQKQRHQPTKKQPAITTKMKQNKKEILE